MLIATEKKTVFVKDYLSGAQLKKLLEELVGVMTAWPDEGSLNVNFIAVHEQTTIVFNGGYAEALELLEKYPNLVISPGPLSGLKIAWKKTKVILKDGNIINAQAKRKLEIEVESEDIMRTKKIMAAVLESLENA